MQLADLSGIRPLFLNKQAHKSHVLQHRKKGFASRANPFNLQIISYIYFSDTSISVQVFNRSLRLFNTALIFFYLQIESLNSQILRLDSNLKDKDIIIELLKERRKDM